MDDNELYYEDEIGEPDEVDAKEESYLFKKLEMDWAARPWQFDSVEPQYIGFKYDSKNNKKQWYWLDWSDVRTNPIGPTPEKMDEKEVPASIMKLAQETFDKRRKASAKKKEVKKKEEKKKDKKKEEKKKEVKKKEEKKSEKKRGEFIWKTKEYGFKNMSDGTHAWFKSSDAGKTYQRVKANTLTLKARCRAIEKAKEPPQKSCQKKPRKVKEKSKTATKKKTPEAGEKKKPRNKKEYTYEALLKHGNFLYITGDDKYILVASKKSKSAKPKPRFYERQANKKYRAVKKENVPAQIVLDAQDELEDS